SRVQIKPNIGPAVTGPSASEEQKPVAKDNGAVGTSSSAASIESTATPVEIIPSTSSGDSSNGASGLVAIQPIDTSSVQVETTENQDHVFRSPLPKRTDPGHITSPRTRLISTSSAIEGAALISPRSRLLSTCSEMFGHQKKEKRKFTGDEELDPKTMRMIDLISWNPKNEKKLDRTKLDNCETRSEMEREDERPAAPQLKLDANGKLVVDETSLLLDERATNSVWQVVDEDRSTRKVNSTSFRRWRKGTAWSEKETEFFYEVLRSTGPDFGLMHDFFPRRARNELKSKYNREERFNWERLKSVLSKPITLEESLYERAETMAIELNREETEKMEAKQMKKTKNGEISRVVEEEWDEDKADLEREAQEMINELIEVDRRKEELARIKKEEKKKRAEEKRKLSKEATAILDQTAKVIKKRKKKEDEESKGDAVKKKKERISKGVEKDSSKLKIITGYPESDDSEHEAAV
ncbi:hypothetical protein PENTCL1PPCAC_22743, partial [Pristionchus entomophagus]